MSDSSSKLPFPHRLLPALLHSWVWRMAWRDARSEWHRLCLYSLAIASGVAALTAIHSIKVSVEKAVEVQAKSLLGADLLVSSRQPFAPADLQSMRSLSQDSSQEITFSSMLFFPKSDAAKLVQVRALEGGYPFYGRIETKPVEAKDELKKKSGVVLESTLMDQFNLKIGDTVKLGNLDLVILGTILKPAPRSSRFSGIAPEIYLNLRELPATGLLGTASLSFYNLYLQGIDLTQIKNLESKYENKGWRFETPDNRRESIEKVLNVFQQFLGLIAIIALILGAIGVASAIQNHLVRRMSSIAILRCLGCPSQAAYAIYLLQSMALGLIGSITGGVLGILLHSGLLFVFKNQITFPIDPSPQWITALMTTSIGFAVCTAFTLLPLSRITSISPGLALNNTLPTLTKKISLSFLFSILFLFVMLALLAWLNIPDPKKATAMVVSLLVVLACLTGVAQLIIVVVRRFTPASWPYLLRQGLANLHRPYNQTLLFLFSLGLGAFLLSLVLMAKNAALERIHPPNKLSSPSIYFVDIQTNQLSGVIALIKKLNLPVLDSAPIVTMRIKSVKSVPVQELQEQQKIPRWILQREFRSSYRNQLNATEYILEGRWVTTHTAAAIEAVPISLESSMAKDLGVTVGDELEVDIQGVVIKTKIASLRKVDWSNFNLNFFMLFPLGVLEEAPGFHIVTTRLPVNTSSGELQRELVKQFPNVTAIDLTLILQTVDEILEKISLVIQLVVGFTLASGLAILIGVLLNANTQRLRESALLRTLGASSKQVRTILVIEYAALGFFSGLTGVILALLAYIPLSIYVFESSFWPSVIIPLTVIAGTIFLSTLAGLFLSRNVCSHPPLQVLTQ